VPRRLGRRRAGGGHRLIREQRSASVGAVAEKGRSRRQAATTRGDWGRATAVVGEARLGFCLGFPLLGFYACAMVDASRTANDFISVADLPVPGIIG
jgi:hypothetical protein